MIGGDRSAVEVERFRCEPSAVERPRASREQVLAVSAAPAPEPFTRSLERMNRFQEPEARALIADLALPAGSRGSTWAAAWGSRALARGGRGPAGRVTGIEPTAERVDAARALVAGAAAADRLDFRTGDGTALEAVNGSFDWVWCGDVLHHILDTQGALKEMIRVCRPGGLVVIKESQALPAMFLPGHPELEKRLQQAEIARSRAEAGERSFQERRSARRSRCARPASGR